MRGFTYVSPTVIICGREECEKAENSVGALCAKHKVSKVLLHYGQGSIKKIGLYDQVVKSLKNQGIDYVDFGGVVPNPRLSLVRKGIEICKDKNIDLILAVGGGSVIDSAKAIAAGVGTPEEDVWELCVHRDEHPVKDALPVGVILTIPASGSESSYAAVITNDEKGGYYMCKYAIHSDRIRPKFAILNPELTLDLPPYHTACGLLDMFSHVFERYFPLEKGNDVTDGLCEELMRRIICLAPRVLKNPQDYDLRANVMWAAKMAHDGYLGVGRTTEFASHRIEHGFSAVAPDLAHAAGLALIIPAWMEYLCNKSYKRMFKTYAKKVWGKNSSYEGIKATKKWFKQLKMPASFKQAGILNPNLEKIVDSAMKGPTIGEIVRLRREDIIKILQKIPLE